MTEAAKKPAQAANTSPWWAYSLSYIAAVLIALDCGIAMYYLMIAQSVIPFPLGLMIACISATILLNALVYANGGADAIAYTFGKIKAKYEAPKSAKAAFIAISLGSGLIMAGFTLYAYLEISSALLTLPFAIIMSAAYLLGTYNLIYYAMITSYETMGKTIQQAIGQFKAETEPDGTEKRVSFGQAFKSLKDASAADWARLVIPFVLIQVPTALANYTFTKGFISFLTTYAHLSPGLALGIGIAVTTFLFIGELFFATKASLWISTQLRNLSHKTAASETQDGALSPKAAQDNPTQSNSKLKQGLLLLGMSMIAAAVLINGYGFMSTTVAASSSLLQGWIFGILGAILSVSIMTKNIADLIEDKDTLLPQQKADKIKSITWTLVGLGMLASVWAIQPISAVFTSQALLITTVASTMLLLMAIGSLVQALYSSAGVSTSTLQLDGGSRDVPMPKAIELFEEPEPEPEPQQAPDNHDQVTAPAAAAAAAL